MQSKQARLKEIEEELDKLDGKRFELLEEKEELEQDEVTPH